MARIDLYLSEKEKAWVQMQGTGFIRTILKRYMEKYPDQKVPIAKEGK